MHQKSNVTVADLSEVPVFNPQQFEVLTLGDPILQRRLIESFLAQGSRNRADVLAAAEAGAEQLSQVVHRLKGSCHFTAAERLLGLIRSMDGAGLRSRESRLVHARAIVSALEELENALSSFLAAGKAT